MPAGIYGKHCHQNCVGWTSLGSWCGHGTHTKTSLFHSAIYGGPVVNEPRGSRYHLPPVVIWSMACSMLSTSQGLNPGMIFANCCLPVKQILVNWLCNFIIVVKSQECLFLAWKNSINKKSDHLRNASRMLCEYLTSFGMNLLGMWSSSRRVVISEPLAQRNRAWLGILTPGQTPSLASRTAKSRLLLSYASSWSCL